jgi:tripartite-type tricarboxylate transporter receptor subunit TctC
VQFHRANLRRIFDALCTLAIAAPLLLGTATSFGQSYPSRPIKLIVGYPPGGSGDFLTRLMADEMSRELGVSVVVDNRPGAGGNIAAEAVARSPADGYTVLNGGHWAINRALYRTISYDGEHDFVPITLVATGPTIICVNNDLPVHSLSELIGYAKANPGKLFNAGAGYGSAPHLAAVAFETAAGVKFTSVQFKGGGPAAQSLIAGETQVMFATPPTVMGFIQTGRMRALAITTPEASAAVPGIPGAREAGLPGYESTFWFGLWAPVGTPAPIIKRLHEAATTVLAKAEVKRKIALQGMDAAPSASPEAFAERIKVEAPMWERVVRESGAKID